MNPRFAAKLLKKIGKVGVPNSESEILEHPNPRLRGTESVTIGFVMEHRFAFYYWIQCKEELRTDRRSKKVVPDRDFWPPDLVTWDWHDDVGGECDFDKSELQKLNQTDEEEVALFCWAGLRQLDDGHVAPAMWLNAIGNVFVVKKQHDDGYRSRELIDRYGNAHRVYYSRGFPDFAKKFERHHNGQGVIWDVDMDFFTRGSKSDCNYTAPVSDATFKRLLSPTNQWMRQILSNLKAITIALEPKYTGGLSVSLDLYRKWENVLFAVPVFNDNCRWKTNVGKSLERQLN